MDLEYSSNETTVNGETFEYVTVEMTSNVNNSTINVYDEKLDNIDYNNKDDIAKYNLTTNAVSY
jgi:hypothetical protein